MEEPPPPPNNFNTGFFTEGSQKALGKRKMEHLTDLQSGKSDLVASVWHRSPPQEVPTLRRLAERALNEAIGVRNLDPVETAEYYVGYNREPRRRQWTQRDGTPGDPMRGPVPPDYYGSAPHWGSLTMIPERYGGQYQSWPGDEAGSIGGSFSGAPHRLGGSGRLQAGDEGVSYETGGFPPLYQDADGRASNSIWARMVEYILVLSALGALTWQRK